MSLSKIILTTGGTGGHIFPALAVADELTRRNPGIKILFVGGAGPEGDMARKHGLDFLELPAKGIMGRGIKGILSGLGWLGFGIPKAMHAVKRFAPDAVIGFGGYAGFCPVLAAALLGIPTAVHEQNSVPGVTNKVLGKMVKKIFLSFPDTLGAFPPAKTVLTGNPVRAEIINAASARAQRKIGRHILVLGGSQGARAINDSVIQALPMFMNAGVKLTHQAGASDYQRVHDSYKTALADSGQVHAFIDNMAACYAAADLIICRSGATTVFEIAAAGVPAIFVPFPHATHDHQTMNAKAMSDIGAARLLPQKEMTGEVLASLALELLNAPAQVKDMGTAARRFAKERAAADIAVGLEALAA
ncbi:undecaprenyldiphospho-muramoylpentapeptide beta-N-acetylglucosaminyltransferase [Pseudodesulfovibrio piezophilus]|uniref:UDP-N-acetylglucosamine--N-acetylmuramyl-(pentapeptide) pyrophosphoryl-undecaprenol N-acetylglucosamine transferase n=1 Tax=Pseudodesulfovibrio piezophilus (strain DSM 21447 / JCM 15486 / C1TLV30) TaxID=1322246 RepID=M1WM18_PSEP2|nr:undecaprenyldiphospho-muramoylpentapeptide beta-N-acetylglucosaminyltransferase [Pseudodesulfovibrio piezophilus]CCH48835.1 UDP-N-acetylglucosamine--N-acetylmuramyl-(pentapeptide) pyrophosphoryl-undecaprenol N-acetylglucosamine transferase [Pseudodesulfovibrio piezophilus C1TLV30]